MNPGGELDCRSLSQWEGGWVWGMALLPAQFPHLQEDRSSHCTWWAAVESQGEATKPGEVEEQQGALKAQRGTPSGSVGPQDALEMIKKYKEK